MHRYTGLLKDMSKSTASLVHINVCAKIFDFQDTNFRLKTDNSSIS